MFELIAYIVVTVEVLALCGNGKSPAAASATAIEKMSLPERFAAADAIMAKPLYDEPVAVAEVPEVPATVAVDEQVTHQAAPDYNAMDIVELKALGKLHNVKGWKAWKKTATAIARLEAFDTDMADYMAEQAYQAHCAEIAYEASLAA